ncbi:MAG: hypothetical protein A2X56_05515 [Nitrospirae bacterium GWC2_57_13]|jgi:hypothetical protein|nr:MAG: hypothetical protein A2X56_05515 [Nitrospirae bacterium GWC2_57_13]HAR45459.1 hypothetical protein [Nitrospiraceae bacterium]HAS55269.1 hypothetical protein [Nitrospiraceae bacterium]
MGAFDILDKDHTRRNAMSTLRKFTVAGIAVCLMAAAAPAAFALEARAIPEGKQYSATGAEFNSSRFQAGIKGDKGLGELAKENTSLGDPATSFGFAAKSEEAKFFLIGSLYSEALAYVRGGKMDLAAKRLESIQSEFINIGVPSSLYNYISKMRQLIETKRHTEEALLDFLALFQPFFEDYAKSKSADKLTLFRAGSWLVDMGLASAGGDKELLRQTDKLTYFIAEMKRMDAPKGALEALDEIAGIAGKKEISDRDAKSVLKLVKKIQAVLG